jgi:undecaprenyl diphosphate synthase
MILLDRFLAERTAEIMERNIRLLAIGHLQDLPDKARKRLEDTIAKSANNTAMTLTLALSYGARTEIVDAARRIAREVKAGTLDPETVSEDTISSHLYTAGIPDPDLLVRTSGEMRISNFLLWQISYAEIVVTPKLWPDFTKEDLFAAMQEYARRNRRYGGI